MDGRFWNTATEGGGDITFSDPVDGKLADGR